jgi:hypothetical protein
VWAILDVRETSFHGVEPCDHKHVWTDLLVVFFWKIEDVSHEIRTFNTLLAILIGFISKSFLIRFIEHQNHNNYNTDVFDILNRFLQTHQQHYAQLHVFQTKHVSCFCWNLCMCAHSRIRACSCIPYTSHNLKHHQLYESPLAVTRLTVYCRALFFLCEDSFALVFEHVSVFRFKCHKSTP